jgi:hypothetical protein
VPFGQDSQRSQGVGDDWVGEQAKADLADVFRSPHGYVYLVTNQGTQSLGTATFAQAVWRAASDEDRLPAPYFTG